MGILVDSHLSQVVEVVQPTSTDNADENWKRVHLSIDIELGISMLAFVVVGHRSARGVGEERCFRW